jgi:hypothetical protein
MRYRNSYLLHGLRCPWADAGNTETASQPAGGASSGNSALVVDGGLRANTARALASR